MRPGLFITLEGIDGSGKSTQSIRLNERLAKEGYKTGLHVEPTKGPIGTEVRRILRKGGTDISVLPWLFAADRALHCNEIKYRLSVGDNVVCDRYYLSALAYQSLNWPMGYIWEINKHFLRPDLILFIDTPVTVCVERLVGREGDAEYFEKRELLELVRNNYEQAIMLMEATFVEQGSNHRIARINGDQTEEELAEQVWEVVHAHMT